MAIPVLPESAPFAPAQRAWLNGFFAGVFGLDRNGTVAALNGAALIPEEAPKPPEPVEEDFPWHDPAMSMDERLKLAEGKPYERILMAAMAQVDCGSCGHLCKSYAEAIANGEETDLTKCSPGGKETAKKLKELVASRKALPTVEADGNHASNGKIPAIANAATSGTAKPSLNGNGVHYDRKHPFHSPLLQCRQLTKPGSEKDVRFAAFSLQGSGLKYEVGDSLGLVPENDPELVEAVLKAMGARGDELVPTPGGATAHAFDALAKHYVITKVSDNFAKLLAASASDQSESSTLKTLVNDDVEGIPAGWDILDLLEQFPSARAALAEMIAALSPLQPRLYSISSSLRAHPGEVHLTIGVVRYSQAGRLRKGVASNFVTETLRTRHKAGVFIHVSPGFRLPADSGTPIIMVGPGTGIAPFRAFLQDRAATGAKGKNWLFFGDQRREFDFLYEPEMTEYQKQGVLTNLHTAFSRDQKDKIYVQNRMMENAAEIWKWLQDGAHFYVCGDARRMALDVDHALHAIAAQQGGMSPEQANEYVKSLSKAKRYQRDVY
jgi:sulfite reductase (NADPH) flavoprotein alpha-component